MAFSWILTTTVCFISCPDSTALSVRCSNPQRTYLLRFQTRGRCLEWQVAIEQRTSTDNPDLSSDVRQSILELKFRVLILGLDNAGKTAVLRNILRGESSCEL